MSRKIPGLKSFVARLAASPVAVALAALVTPAFLASSRAADKLPEVQVVRRDAQRRVDILVGGRPFTSYVWPTALAKPVLYPIRTDIGQLVTRGFPLDPRPQESNDHPHQVGLWFNYGDVAGADFWNNSAAIRDVKPSSKDGSIVHRAIESARGGPGRGELAVSADWMMPDGKLALRELTRFGFAAEPGRLAIDRVATLTASSGPVAFPDNKEGMLAMRLARSLEHPSDKNRDGTGSYRSSEGKVGDQAWGTRARWMMLTGQADGSPVTIAILDHPKNPGYPTYWHARGYGLFGANPLGQKIFSEGKETPGLRARARWSRALRLPDPAPVTHGEARGDRGRVPPFHHRSEVGGMRATMNVSRRSEAVVDRRNEVRGRSSRGAYLGLLLALGCAARAPLPPCGATPATAATAATPATDATPAAAATSLQGATATPGAADGKEASVRPGANDQYLQSEDISEWIRRFESGGREIFDQRMAILKASGIAPGFVVADVGAGTGLFSRLFARAVGPGGRVYAVDIVPNFLDHIESESKRLGIGNITTVLGDDRSAKLPQSSVDLVFLCDAYHHFEYPRAMSASLLQGLRPGGILMLIDFKRVPGKSPPGILEHVRAGQEVFTAELEAAGFEKIGEDALLKENYVVRFRKPAAAK